MKRSAGGLPANFCCTTSPYGSIPKDKWALPMHMAPHAPRPHEIKGRTSLCELGDDLLCSCTLVAETRGGKSLSLRSQRRSPKYLKCLLHVSTSSLSPLVPIYKNPRWQWIESWMPATGPSHPPSLYEAVAGASTSQLCWPLSWPMPTV